MAELSERYRPSPVNWMLIALLLVATVVLVKTQRWHSPRVEPAPPTLPAEVGPAEGELFAELLHTSPTIRVLLRSSRQPLSADAEGYPGRVEVVEGDGRFLRICHVDLETYVAQVVTGELPGDWGRTIKRAQAVAARSYAMTEMDGARAYDIRASALAQNFRAEDIDPVARDATRDTWGMVLTDGDEVLRAFYHATCGGRTVSPTERWTMRGPRIPSVECPFCATAPLFRWSHEVTLDALSTTLGMPVSALWVEAFDSTGRAQTVALRTPDGLAWMTGDELREALGYVHLRSTWFAIEALDGAVRFNGAGSGHGVGMCQWGAHAMARAGHGWKDILGFYYDGAALRRAY